MPMSELAAELGRSLLFPVDCRYCGDRIFLYANPDGGFAMFDDVGPPWPKHHCHGRLGRPAEGYRFPASPFSPRYDMPVPKGVETVEYQNGNPLKGAVVLMKQAMVPRRVGDLYDVVLFNGRFLYVIRTRESLSLGVFVAGIPRFSSGVGTCLEEIVQLDPTRDLKMSLLSRSGSRFD
jgi:hypothetical protein